MSLVINWRRFYYSSSNFSNVKCLNFFLKSTPSQKNIILDIKSVINGLIKNNDFSLILKRGFQVIIIILCPIVNFAVSICPKGRWSNLIKKALWLMLKNTHSLPWNCFANCIVHGLILHHHNIIDQVMIIRQGLIGLVIKVVTVLLSVGCRALVPNFYDKSFFVLLKERSITLSNFINVIKSKAS